MKDSAGEGRNEAVFSRELGRGGKRASVAIGVAVLVAIVSIVGASLGLSINAGRSQFYQVKAHFPTVNGVIEGSDVFFGGVRVGNVSDLKVDPDSHGATITLNIDRKYAPVHEGATAAVRPKSLLGEKYVAMTVGDAGKPAICDGCQLPDSATAVNVELDQLINILDEPTRKELQALIDSLGTGLAGQGPNLNQTLQTGQDNLTALAQVTDVLSARDAELKRIIAALTQLTQTLSTDQQRSTYVNLLKHSDQVLQTLKAEDATVQQSIDRTDQFFNELDQGLNGQGGNLQGIFADLPNTVTQLDALSVALGRQANVGYPAIKAAAAGVVEGPLIFGSQPSNHYTQDIFTRVMPAQGCFNVNGRTTDANGLQQNNSQLINTRCTLPGTGIVDCTAQPPTATSGSNCVLATLQSICLLFHNQLPGCTALPAPAAAAGAQGARPATPNLTSPAPQSQQASPPPPVNPNALNGLLGFLLH